MEGYSNVSSGLDPAFKADDKHGPAKCKARNSNSNIKEHHNICRAKSLAPKKTFREENTLDYHHSLDA